MPAPPPTITIDDRSPNITYHGAWVLAGSEELEYDNTTHGALGADAQLTFPFTGALVRVYGTIGRDNPNPIAAPVLAFVVDGVQNGTFTAIPRANILFREMFFASQMLDAGKPHTLVVTNTLDGKNPSWIDYFEVEPGGNGVNSDSTETTSTSSSTSSSTSTSAAGGLPATTVVGIVLGVLGGVLLLTIITWISVALIRQNRRRWDGGGTENGRLVGAEMSPGERGGRGYRISGGTPMKNSPVRSAADSSGESSARFVGVLA